MVRGFRGQFQLVVNLIEKLLGLRRVAFHVPFVGLLRGTDFFPCIAREALRRGKIRMLVAVTLSLGI